jgi:glycosyltransferase involved in cell wall biosynthesis
MSDLHVNPVVTVLIPTFNYAHYVRHSVESVARQSFGGFEIIVIDDGSSDQTQDVIASIECANLRYVRHEANRGLAAARNTGLALARGRYVALLDADDEMKRDNLARKVQVLEELGDVALVHGAVEPMDGAGRPLAYTKRKNNGEIRVQKLFPEVLHGDPINGSSVIAKKEAIEDVGGFDASLEYGENWDLWIRLSRRFRFAYLPEPLVRYRIHPTSMQWRAWGEGRDLAATERILRKAFSEFNLERDGLDFERLYWEHYYRRLGNQAESLPFASFARLFLNGAVKSPREALRSPGIKAGIKLVARGVLPQRMLLRWRFQRHVRKAAGEPARIFDRALALRRRRDSDDVRRSRS